MTVFRIIKEKRITIFFIISLFFLFFLFIFIKQKGLDESHKIIKEYELRCKDNLSQTEVLLAKAVLNNNTRKIKNILKKRIDIIEKSYTNQKFYSILHFAVETQKYKAAKQLLECGYNPNIQDSSGTTPLFLATEYLTLYLTLKYYPDNITLFIDLLLDFTGSPDIVNNKGESPLIENTKYYTDKKENLIAKLLVEKGKCNIDLLDNTGHSAVYYALKYQEIYLVNYLIVDQKGDIKNDISLCPLLKEMIYPLDSEEYKLKKEIIKEFENQGIDYYSEPIPDDVLEKIKKEYPNNWEEYIKVY